MLKSSHNSFIIPLRAVGGYPIWLPCGFRKKSEKLFQQQIRNCRSLLLSPSPARFILNFRLLFLGFLVCSFFFFYFFTALCSCGKWKRCTAAITHWDQKYVPIFIMGAVKRQKPNDNATWCPRKKPRFARERVG